MLYYHKNLISRRERVLCSKFQISLVSLHDGEAAPKSLKKSLNLPADIPGARNLNFTEQRRPPNFLHLLPYPTTPNPRKNVS